MWDGTQQFWLHVPDIWIVLAQLLDIHLDLVFFLLPNDAGNVTDGREEPVSIRALWTKNHMGTSGTAAPAKCLFPFTKSLAAGCIYWCEPGLVQAGQAASGRQQGAGWQWQGTPGNSPRPDTALPSAHEHPSKPDPEQGIVAAVQHSSRCQRLHVLLPDNFMCFISEMGFSALDA